MFDAAYLVAVLGEIPDQDEALRELRRVLKPDASGTSASFGARADP
jgi:ubiquinone/menaquinone biosynthesis C-methylase UbiE